MRRLLLDQFQRLQLAAVHQLQVGHAQVGTGHLHQLLVRAALHDAAVLHHDDEIRAAQRAEAVRHDERRAARDGAVERLENLVLRLAVDRRGRVVEQQDRRLEQHGARDGEALALAAGERVAAFAEHVS
jgi:hypothetical protein